MDQLIAPDDTFEVAGTVEAGYVEGLVPDVVSELSHEALGSRALVEAEIDAMLVVVRDFYRLEPDEVMRNISGFSARCSELAIQLHRVEGRYSEYRQIRTLQVGKLIEELDRQFKTASRLVELRRQDLEVLRG